MSVLRPICSQNNGYSEHLNDLVELFNDQDMIVPDDQGMIVPDDQDLIVPDLQGQTIDHVGPWMGQPDNIQNCINPNLMNR